MRTAFGAERLVHPGGEGGDGFDQRPEALRESNDLCFAERLLDDEGAYRKMARGASPYGDGHAAERTAVALGL